MTDLNSLSAVRNLSLLQRFAFLNLLGILLVSSASQGRAAQTVFLSDAWWSFQQDCNGDGCRAGTLPGEMARLNWEPDVTNCVGSFLVFEKVYARACGTLPWTPIYTNNLHAITACRSLNQLFVDLPMTSGCACRDYKIEIYRNGQTSPDHIRSSTNDVDLAQHKEQW